MSARRILVPFAAALVISALFLAPSAGAAGGTVMGWGYNAQGEATGTPTGGPCECAKSPVTVPGLTNVTQATGAGSTSFALRDDGSLWAWGDASVGLLGTGDVEADNPTPAPVPGLASVIAVESGEDHALALLSSGTVMSWGDNEFGQLGIGSIEGPEKCSSDPCRKSPGPVPGLANVVAIAANADVSFALLGDGTVMGWGENEYGQTGDGVGIQTGCRCVDHPVAIPGVSNAIAISAGETFGQAVLQDGTLRAWGEDFYGQLGRGTRTDAFSPPCLCLVAMQPLQRGVRAVATGSFHTIAMLNDRTLTSWGYNTSGQLGTGGTTNPECTCAVVPAALPGLSGVQEVAASGYYGFALLADGTVRAWGEGSNGTMGNGDLEGRAEPTLIPSLSGVSALGTREYGGLAIVGPSQTMNVAFAGAGSGTVGGGDVACPPNCSGRYPQGKVSVLRASSTAGGFAGFSGPCTGTAPCQARMNTDQTVTATFGVPKGTAITSSDVNSKKKKATFTFSAPGAITGYECKLIKPKAKKKAKGKAKRALLKKKGAKKPKPVQFSACTGPAAYKNLKPGKYTFEVRALDILGADANPAVKKFTIKKPKPKKRKKK